MWTNYLFPLTKKCFNKGLDRWNEPVDLGEKNQYCGPEDRPCIDCYIPLSLICVPFDIISCCLLCQKFSSKESDIVEENQKEDTQTTYNLDTKQETQGQITYI